jgi:hypothetical protein
VIVITPTEMVEDGAAKAAILDAVLQLRYARVPFDERVLIGVISDRSG